MSDHDPGDIAQETYLCAPPESHHWVYQLSLEGVWVGKCSMCPTLTVDLEQHDARVRSDTADKIAQAIEAVNHEGFAYQTVIEAECAAIARSFKVHDVTAEPLDEDSLAETSWLLQQILRALGDEYGPTGVLRTAEALVKRGLKEASDE
jgi:hypothetical protein